MFVEVNCDKNVYNVNVKVNQCEDAHQLVARRERILWGDTAYVESRFYDSVVELVYSECKTEQQKQERFSRVNLREFVGCSDTIANSRRRGGQRPNYQFCDDDEPPVWLFSPSFHRKL
jgi:hypothetical protein